ncbi:MAG: 50S ribosomal protein L25 [Parcubacteria group bacterium]|nr:50S ribosomal protein L25 [Parcubacteria group bacterium]
MTSIQASLRQEQGRKTNALRGAGKIPAVLYGPKSKSQMISVEQREFEKAFKEAGESTLLSLEVGDRKVPVLIHDVQRDPLQGTVIHIDFYEPPLDKKVKVDLPITVQGEAPAVKELGGTLIRHIQEISVSALPQNLPHELICNVESLATFEDRIFVKDIRIPEGVTIEHTLEDVVAQVVPVTDVEKELATPVEERVEEVAKIEKEKKEEPEEESAESTPTQE